METQLNQLNQLNIIDETQNTKQFNLSDFIFNNIFEIILFLVLIGLIIYELVFKKSNLFSSSANLKIQYGGNVLSSIGTGALGAASLAGKGALGAASLAGKGALGAASLAGKGALGAASLAGKGALGAVGGVGKGALGAVGGVGKGALGSLGSGLSGITSPLTERFSSLAENYGNANNVGSTVKDAIFYVLQLAIIILVFLPCLSLLAIIVLCYFFIRPKIKYLKSL